MAGLIIEILLKAFLSVGVAAFVLLVLNTSADFQLLFVLSFYVYCSLVLFTFSRDKLFHLLSIPILTQFLHLFQKYSFPGGANSLWRLAPFLIVLAYLANFLSRKKVVLHASEQTFLLCWLVISFFYIVISPNLEGIIVGAAVLWLLLLPGFFLYLKFAMQATDFRVALEKYLCLCYVILGAGTFGLVFAGAAYKGSDNLLATRNISDTNVTMAYFILLLPFSFLYTSQLRLLFGFPARLGLVAILMAVVVFSFSRGAIFMMVPYLLIVMWLISRRETILVLLIVAGILATVTALVQKNPYVQDMGYFWALRFGEAFANPAFDKLLESSGRREIQTIAYQLFLQSPLFGHGIGSFEILGPGYREAHSLWYTLLAENGLIGAICMYLILAKCLAQLRRTSAQGRGYNILFVSMLFYLIFNHTVGSVFVIIPSRSLTINCIAPILLLCQYFYAKHIQSDMDV